MKTTREILAMTRTIRIATLSIVCLGAFATTLAAQPSIAVADFTNEVGNLYWWRGSVGRDLAGMVSNELASLGSFNVIERSKVDAVLDEQDLVSSGAVDPATGAEVGRMTGADYVVLGTVTSYEEQSRKGGGLGYKGIRVGGKKGETYIAVDLRVVDTTSSEIEYVRTVEGTTASRGVSLSGYRSGLSGSLSSESNTPAGKAIRSAIIEITDYLECAMVLQDSCMGEYDSKERRRREKAKDGLKLD